MYLHWPQVYFVLLYILITWEAGGSWTSERSTLVSSPSVFMTSKPRSVQKLPATDNELSSGSTISEKKRKDTSNINPLLSPQGAIYFKPIWWGEGANRDRRLIWEEGGLFNLEVTMVSVLHKELEYKEEKLKCKKVGGHAAWTSGW